MSSNQAKYSINVKQTVSTPSKIIGQLFNYYKGREYTLVNLARSRGATNVEIANALGIDPALISRNYPKGDKK